MSTKFLIIGGSGQLGTDLQHVLTTRKADFTVPEVGVLDITNKSAVLDYVTGYDVIINAAAYTQVDAAETHEDDAYAVNANAVGYLARAAAANKARFVTISTDYVFHGDATTPYPEDAPRNPLGAYGRTKAAGEALAQEIYPERTYIVRTAWLYGKRGPNFPQTILKLAKTNPTLSVVNDQFGQPTWSHDLAERICDVLEQDIPPGIYHGTNAGQTSWYDFARTLFRHANLDPERILPTDSTAFVRPAPRPSFSVLSHEGWNSVGISPMRSWETALEEASRSGVFEEA